MSCWLADRLTNIGPAFAGLMRSIEAPIPDCGTQSGGPAIADDERVNGGASGAVSLDQPPGRLG
jgi:hypothetical protein